MARKAPFRVAWLLMFVLVMAGCSGTTGDGGNTATGSPSETPSASSASPCPTDSATPSGAGEGSGGCDPACATVSPNSPGEASCQAAGIPETTGGDERCGSAASSGSAPAGLIEGTFGPYCENAVASTYNTDAIPDEAAGIVTVSEGNADTTVQFSAQGFAPEKTYRAQLHENSCGASPADAGAQVQNPSPGTGGSGLSVDFTTDSNGNATATATVPWVLPDSGKGNSLLIYQEASGGEGDAAGCMTLAQ